MLIVQSPLVVGFCSFVVQRDLNREAGGEAGIAVAEECSKGIENTARYRLWQRRRSEEELAPLRTSETVLIESPGYVYDGLGLVLCVRDLDVFVLEIQQRLSHLRPVLERNANRFFQRRNLHDIRLEGQIQRAQLDQKH